MRDRVKVSAGRCFWLGTVALAFASGMAIGPARAEVKIGAVMSTTGALQVYGEAGLKGIQLVVDQINQAGGVLDQDVELSVLPGAGIDHPAPLQQQLHAFSGSAESCPASRYRTAIRTATPFETCSRMTE